MSRPVVRRAKAPDYRYSLEREVVVPKTVLFIMLNPSTADEHIDDPTIRRCMRYARDWGFQKLEVVNLFAARTTNPKYLKGMRDPIGPENLVSIFNAVTDADLVVAAWGANPLAKSQSAFVIRRLMTAGIIKGHREFACIEQNKDGSPKHPLYCEAHLRPRMWLGYKTEGWRP